MIAKKCAFPVLTFNISAKNRAPLLSFCRNDFKGRRRTGHYCNEPGDLCRIEIKGVRLRTSARVSCSWVARTAVSAQSSRLAGKLPPESPPLPVLFIHEISWRKSREKGVSIDHPGSRAGAPGRFVPLSNQSLPREFLKYETDKCPDLIPGIFFQRKVR